MRTVSTAYSGTPSARATIGLDAPGSGRPGTRPASRSTHGRFGERLQADVDEVALAGAPVRPLVQQLRAGQRHDVDGRRVRHHSQEVVDEVEQPRVGVVEVLEDQHDRRRRGQPLEERAPRPEQLVRGPRRPPRPSRVRSADSIQRRSSGSGTCSATVAAILARVVASSSVSSRPARRRTISPSAQKRDALAVGRAAAVVPPDRLDQAVHVLEELPRQPGLADAGRSDDRDEA